MHLLDQALDDAEAESRAAAGRLADLVERLEDLLAIVLADADAGVADFDQQGAVLPGQPRLDLALAGYSARRSKSG